MALSNITAAVQANYVATFAMFKTAADAPYFLWSSAAGSGGAVRQLFWRPHDAVEGTEVVGDALAPYNFLSAMVRPDGSLLVLFDDGIGANPSPSVWRVVFNFDTGEVVEPPARLFEGSRPGLVQLPNAPATHWAMSYQQSARGILYVRESYDGGVTWTQQRPVLNAKVRDTSELAVYGFDATHLMVAQVGDDARRLVELGSLDHTRPLGRVAQVATGSILAVESTQRQVATVNQLTDTLRGALQIDANGDAWMTDRLRVGVDSGVGELLQLTVSGAAPTIDRSRVLGGFAAVGADVLRVRLSDFGIVSALNSVQGTVAADAAVIDLYVSPTMVYAVTYSNVEAKGAFLSRKILGGTPYTIKDGPPHHAVAGCVISGSTTLATAYMDSGGAEHVDLYVETAVAPTLLATHRMPSRVNRLALKMDTATKGKLYVAMVDRLDVYLIDGLDQPLQRAGGWSIVALGQFHDVKLTAKGNLVAALGEGGVGVFAPTGDRLAQARLSGVSADFWRMSKAYAVGDLVQPMPNALYAPQRRYFRCTVAGTSGKNEPLWGPGPATVKDNTVTWVEAGVVDAVVTSVAVDETLNRVYAAGVVGGEQSTAGRVYILAADSWRL